MKPENINDKINIFKIDKKDLIGIYDSNPENPPEEFKDVVRDIDPEIDAPMGQLHKTHVVARRQISRSINVQRSWKH